MRTATIKRETKETRITAELVLEGSGRHDIATGVGFLDHILSHVAVHGFFDLTLRAEGDLEVDAHHTVEDCALVLGQALDQALGDRASITRIGTAQVPMDEALAHVVVDLSGRPYTVVEATWRAPAIGQLPTTLVAHFLRSLATAARCNLHARVLYGEDDHHQAEALFKALGRALDQATALDPRLGGAVPSTKGTL
jgi:imidazoleglycerol-phosphate dehydratase